MKLKIRIKKIFHLSSSNHPKLVIVRDKTHIFLLLFLLRVEWTLHKQKVWRQFPKFQSLTSVYFSLICSFCLLNDPINQHESTPAGYQQFI